MELASSHACFGGEQRFYRHDSRVVGLPMRFAIYLPLPGPLPEGRGRDSPSPLGEKGGMRGLPPLLVYLAGLTCTEETFPMKAGAQRVASRLGMAILCPDTSPRGANIPGEAESWDFGVGAGFYLDATEEPWRRHWRMESYLLEELLPLVGSSFRVDIRRAGLFGHSMGGHGALTLALRHPGRFLSVSALAPVAAPTQCPWGVRAFGGYLGADREAWKAHDATELMARQATPPYPRGILVDQGLDDKFLAEQLKPELFAAACAKAGQPLTLRRHPGYDHSYYFIQSFVADHLRHHARVMNGT